MLCTSCGEGANRSVDPEQNLLTQPHQRLLVVAVCDAVQGGDGVLAVAPGQHPSLLQPPAIHHQLERGLHVTGLAESPCNEIIKLRELPGGEEDGSGGEAELEIRACRLPQLVCNTSQTTPNAEPLGWWSLFLHRHYSCISVNIYR